MSSISQVYSFMGVILCLLLATLCVIKRVSSYCAQLLIPVINCLQRQEEERFKKIDEKRGGRGFV